MDDGPSRRSAPPGWMMAPPLHAEVSPIVAAPLPPAPAVGGQPEPVSVAPVPTVPVHTRPAAHVWPGEAPVVNGPKVRRWDVPHWD
jgi:hypothetical protein